MKFHVVVTSRDSLQILTSKIQDGYRTAPQIFYLSGESNKFGTGSIYSSVDSRGILGVASSTDSTQSSSAEGPEHF